MLTTASLPMYDADRAAVAQFWHAIARRLRAEGLEPPDEPAWPQDLHGHWLDPGLLLSQACGWPLVTVLAGKVQLVGAFRYAAEGCDGIRYRSCLVVRDDDAARSIEDLRGRVAAFNSAGSHSGFNALLASVAPLAEGGRFFSRAVETGSHRGSIEAVQQGRADLAAIDCISFAALRREGWLRVRVIGETPAAPGLPLITSLATTPTQLDGLRRALRQVLADPASAPLRRALFIDGFEAVAPETYREIADMRAAAVAAGCEAL